MGLARRVLSVFLFAGACGTPPCVSAAEQHYLLRELDLYPPYENSILTIDLDAPEISGKISPLRGDERPEMPVSGRKVANDRVLLTIGAPTGPFSLTFQEERPEIWSALDTLPHTLGTPTFLKPPRGELSNAALTLDVNECGIEYGELMVRFERDELLKLDEPPPPLRDLRLSISPKSEGEEPVEYDLVKGWGYIKFLHRTPAAAAEWDQGENGFPFKVPPGSEPELAVALRKLKVVKSVRLGERGCGIGEARAMFVKKALFFADGRFDPNAFRARIEEAMAGLLSSKANANRASAYRIEGATLTENPLPPHWSTLRLQAYGDAMVTRKKGGSWDKFDVLFTPADTIMNQADEVTVIVTVERLYSVTKGGSTTPPTETWFKNQLDGMAEGTVTAQVIGAVSDRLGGACVFRSPIPDVPKATSPCSRTKD